MDPAEKYLAELETIREMGARPIGGRAFSCVSGMGIIWAVRVRCALGSGKCQPKARVSALRQDLMEAGWDAVKRVPGKALA